MKVHVACGMGSTGLLKSALTTPHAVIVTSTKTAVKRCIPSLSWLILFSPKSNLLEIIINVIH